MKTATADSSETIRTDAPRRAGVDIFWRYSPILLLAILWEAGARLGIISTLALPPLDEVARAWVGLLIPGNPHPAAAAGMLAWTEWLLSGDLVVNGASSLWRAVAGLGLAIVVGTLAGILMAWYKPVERIVNPIVQVFYPMPKTALIPVTVLWLGFGDMSKIVLIFIGCMLPVTLSAFNGARGTERTLVWSARGLGASRFRTLVEVVAPSALPELMSGIRTALALSFILLVSSELIVARTGLGYMIGWLGDGGVYDAMFAVVLTVSLLGFIADRSYLALTKRVLAWRE